jgi:hypothetical protein
LESLECNVAQFRSVDDLGDALTRAASINNQGKIPLVFFDEFDCECDSTRLGWLKYFLAPMQDGTFYGAKQTIHVGRAIFVFAGGVYRTIFDFDAFAGAVAGADLDKTETLLKHQIDFREQKGPDFVSRLRGHINILSINPDETAIKDDNGIPIKPIIRRALILRSQIEAAGMIADREGSQVATIDNDILYALLTVDEYRHGVRSMEAILQMCTPLDGLIEKASLPSFAQLNMHVDADEFNIRVQRGRFRSYLPPPEDTTTAGQDAPPDGGPDLGSPDRGVGFRKGAHQTEADSAAEVVAEPPKTGSKSVTPREKKAKSAMPKKTRRGKKRSS